MVLIFEGAKVTFASSPVASMGNIGVFNATWGLNVFLRWKCNNNNHNCEADYKINYFIVNCGSLRIVVHINPISNGPYSHIVYVCTERRNNSKLANQNDNWNSITIKIYHRCMPNLSETSWRKSAFEVSSLWPKSHSCYQKINYIKWNGKVSRWR